jgi:hypothetical protein
MFASAIRHSALFASALALGAFAQTTTTTTSETYQFRILKDDPTAIADKVISLNGATGHFSSAEGLKAGAGVNVLWGLTDKIALQGDLILYYLSINNAGGLNYDLDAAATYPLKSSTQQKEARVVLKFSESTSGNTRTTSATFIPTQGTYLTRYQARGGVFSKRSGVKVDDKPTTEETSFMAHGVFAGLERVEQMCLFTEVDGKNGVTSGLSRIYADLFVLPATSFDEQGTADDPGILGGRLGLAMYLNPNKRNHPEYGRLEFRNAWPTLYAKTEVGLRGGEGWFFQMQAGLSLWRNK